MKIYCNVWDRHRKFENPKISNIFLKKNSVFILFAVIEKNI